MSAMGLRRLAAVLFVAVTITGHGVPDGREGLRAQTPQQQTEVTVVPLLINRLAGHNFPVEQYTEIVRAANEILKQMDIRLEFDPATVDPAATPPGDGDAKIEPGEQTPLNDRGIEELTNKFGAGKGVKIYVGEILLAEPQEGQMFGGYAFHDPELQPVFYLNPNAVVGSATVTGTSVRGNDLAHEFCHLFTLSNGHLIDDANEWNPLDNTTADDTGHHPTDTNNLMSPLNDGPAPRGTTLTEDQQSEVKEKAKTRGEVRTEPAPPGRIGARTSTKVDSKHGAWRDALNDVSPAHVDLFTGTLYAPNADADLRTAVVMRGLYPAAAVSGRVELLFDTDASTATGIANGPFSGIDRILRVDLTGQYPFTAPAGSITAVLINTSANVSTPLQPGHIDRIETILDAPQGPGQRGDFADAVRQTIPRSLLGALAARVPVGVRSTDLSAGLVDETSFTFVFTPPPGPEIDISPSAGRPGDVITVTGRRFKPNSAIRVLIDDDVVLTTTSAADGSFTAGLLFPGAAPNRYFITARDSNSVFDFQVFQNGARLNVAMSGPGSGRILSTPDGIDCGKRCTTLKALDSSVSLSAVPDPDSAFAGWGGDADCQDGVVTLSAARFCEARFVSLPVGVALDLNGDGGGDAFAYDSSTGAWTLETGNRLGDFTSTRGSWSPNWVIRPADFDADGATDFFLYNVLTGQWFKALSDRAGGFTYFSGGWSPGWSIYVRDLDGDRRSDILLYNPTNGLWFKCLHTAAADFRYFSGTWSPNWEIYTVELNGDRFGDLFLHNALTGQWFWAINDGAADFTYVAGTWSTGWEIFSANFNRDARSDLFLYNRQNGMWFIALSTGIGFMYQNGTWSPGWRVRVGDFNADSVADLFVYNPETGQWVECLYDGAGGFSYFGDTWSPAWRTFVTDLNGDRLSDLVLYNTLSGDRFACLNVGPGVFTYVRGSWGVGQAIVATQTRLP